MRMPIEQMEHAYGEGAASPLFSQRPGITGGSLGFLDFSLPNRQSVQIKRAIGTARRARSFVSSRDLCAPPQTLADITAILALSVLAGTAYHEVFLRELGSLREFVSMGAVAAFCFVVTGRVAGDGHPALQTTGYQRFRDALIAWTSAIAVLIFLLFVLKVGDAYSRGAVLTFFAVGLPVIGFWRAYSPPLIRRAAQNIGFATRECIVICGRANPSFFSLLHELAANGGGTPTVVMFEGECSDVSWPQERKLLFSRVFGAAHALRRGEIYICAAGISSDRLASIQRGLSVLPRAIYVIPDALADALVRCKMMPIGSHIAAEICDEPLNLTQRTIKRLIDISLSGAAIVFLLPLFALLAVAIKLDSRGPVLFRQTRNGCGGKPFKILKLRTMHVLDDGPVVRQASRNDPRVTRVGRLLRQTSLDELPQLFNVLMGQMSLVGPRPHAQAHDEMYARFIENYSIRQHLKPGLTGWAQVNGLRGETATLDLMYRRIELDLWYAVHASIRLDIEILVRTVFEVVRRRNAY